MNEMKTLPLAFTYVGVFLGAGFVSGPELWQFFGAFGNWGYVGFLLAAVLFTLFGILLVRLTQVAHTDEMDRLLVPWNIPWLRAASGIVAAGLLFGGGGLWRRPFCSAWWSLWRRDPERY